MRTSPILFAALAVGGVGLLLHLIGLSTPNWLSSRSLNGGLWVACWRSGVCVTINLTLPKLEAARAFSIIGLLAGAASVTLTIVYMFVKDLNIVLMLALAAAAGAAFSVMISFATFVGLYQPLVDLKRWEYSWSFALCVVGFVLFLVQTVLLLVNVINTHRGASSG